MSAGLWIGLAVGVWAFLVAGLLALHRRDRKRLAAALEQLGLTVVSLRPLHMAGAIDGVPIELEHLDWGPEGGGRYLTRIRATGNGTLSKVVVATPGWEWPHRAQTFGLQRLGVGDPRFDRRFELCVENESVGERWRQVHFRQILEIGQPEKLGGVREVAVGGNSVSVCLSGVDVPFDSLRRALFLATQLTRE